jgi:hypothetical protein
MLSADKTGFPQIRAIAKNNPKLKTRLSIRRLRRFTQILRIRRFLKIRVEHFPTIHGNKKRHFYPQMKRDLHRLLKEKKFWNL